MILLLLARWNLKEIKLDVVGSTLNFLKAARRRLFTFFAERWSVSFMSCWVVWNVCFSYIYDFPENSRMVSVLFTMRCF